MKKIFLFIILISNISLFTYSFNKGKTVKKEYYKTAENNLKEIIPDSIIPFCPNEKKENINNSIINIDNLDIKIPKSRSWTKNLINAKLSNSSNINENYKKKFNANIAIKTFNKYCNLPAKIRLSGDWKDHILYDGKNIISSLDIKLINGNINGITKFKLFLPKTRNGSSEILTALFLKEMGYLSPRSKYIKTTINGVPKMMIMQEKANKEMLENNYLRESAIVESDESLLWKLRSENVGSFNGNIFPKVLNTNWVRRNSVNQNIGLEGTNILSRAILESWNRGGSHEEKTFSDLILSNGNKNSKNVLSRFKAHLIAQGADHSLYNHNRRFYYDPLNETFIPIYYDGDSKVRDLKKLNEFIFTKNIDKRVLTRDITNTNIENSIKEIRKINLKKFEKKLNSSGIYLKKNEIEQITKNIISNLKELKKYIYENSEIKLYKNPLTRDNNFYENKGIIFAINQNKFNLCNLNEKKCKFIELRTSEIIDLLSGSYKNKDINYYYLGNSFNPNKNKYYEINLKDDFNYKSFDGLNLKVFGNPDIKVDRKNKLIFIQTYDINQKVLFFNSNISKWDIIIKAPNDMQLLSDSRIDNNLLTGLLTIKDSFLEDVNFNIDGGLLEDSLNIIKSNGNIKNIHIINSNQDAIDFDFSKININQILVKDAGNDCIDLSSGTYYIKEMRLSKCQDKGLSVGEGSLVEIDKAIINDSKIGLVSKDSSKLILNNGNLHNNEICLAAYNKKQEFGPSEIIISNKICRDKNFAIQNLSSLLIK